jgi:hypothetical protein
VRIGGGLLVKQTIPARQSMRPQLALKIPNLGLVRQDIIRARQELQPDCIDLQSPQTKHPLQRHRKIAAAFTILRGKAASEEDCHASRMVFLLTRSSPKHSPFLKDAAVPYSKWISNT